MWPRRSLVYWADAQYTRRESRIQRPILLYVYASTAILLFILLYKPDSSAILLHLLYEPNCAAPLLLLLLYEADGGGGVGTYTP